MITAVKTNNRTIRKNVKICVECGSISLRKEKDKVFCKKCKKFFDMEDSK